MAHKHQIFDLDYRNDSAQTQKLAIDTFFQNNAVESFSISKNETIMITYDELITTKPTRFELIDFGAVGVKSDIAAANANVALGTLVSGNHIVNQQLVEDRVLALQYEEGVITPDKLAERQRVSDQNLSVIGPPVFAEMGTIVLGTVQTGLGAIFNKITQFDTSVRGEQMTVSLVNANITSLVQARFVVNASFSFSGSNNRVYEVAVFVDDVKIPTIAQIQQTGAGGDIEALSFDGSVNVNVGSVIDLRVLPDQANSDFSVHRANFRIDKVR